MVFQLILTVVNMSECLQEVQTAHLGTGRDQNGPQIHSINFNGPPSKDVQFFLILHINKLFLTPLQSFLVWKTASLNKNEQYRDFKYLHKIHFA